MVWNGIWNPDLEKETENNRRESIPIIMTPCCCEVAVAISSKSLK
jgi:hypothetical protein